MHTDVEPVRFAFKLFVETTQELFIKENKFAFQKWCT